MVYRMPQNDRVGPGAGAALNPDDGEVVHDDELLSGSRPEASVRPEPYPSRPPRASQRVSRALMHELEGETLGGRYQVDRVLARTAQEVVLHARHLELGQRVLLRYLTPEASASPEAVARFQRGARKARELRSEHAERVIDFGRLEGGNPYRASELPSGPSLAEIVRVRGALPVTEAVDIVMAACEPVAEAHASGILHRSLSPSNIFLERRSDGSPLVRVLDFGVADPLEPDWTTGEDAPSQGPSATSDSLPYASPEQIRNPGAVDARADVWALGAILYELLAGSRLFWAESPLSLLAMISADAPTPLDTLRPDVPPDLETLVLGCLEKDPDNRPRNVVELVLALAAFASPEAQPAAARVARIVTRTTRPPTLPSMRPSLRPSQRSSALVHSRPPSRLASQMLTVSAPEGRGLGMLFAGAGIGVAAALLTAILLRQPAAPVAVAAEPPKAELAPRAAEVPAVVQAAPVAPAVPAASSVAAAPVTPPAAPVAPPARVVAHSPAPKAAPVAPTPKPASPARASEKPDSAAKTAANSERPADPKPTAAADLFSGMD